MDFTIAGKQIYTLQIILHYTLPVLPQLRVLIVKLTIFQIQLIPACLWTTKMADRKKQIAMSLLAQSLTHFGPTCLRRRKKMKKND